MYYKKIWITIILLMFCILFYGCDTDLSCVSEVHRNIPVPNDSTIVYSSGSPQWGWFVSLRNFNHPSTSFQLTPGPFDTEASWSLDKQWIVYKRCNYDKHVFQIWKMRYDGSNKKVLTPPDIDCVSPYISPDGKRIVFAVERSGRPSYLFVMDTTGGNWQQIVDSLTLSPITSYSFPRWSPDGQRVIFTFSESLDSSMIGIIDLNTKDFTHISSIDSLNPYAADWSPTRDEIVFSGTTNSKEGMYLYRVNIDGSGLTQLTHSGGSYWPDWSPDGERIAYAHIDLPGDPQEIWIMNRDGSNKRRIIWSKGDETIPSW